MDVYILIAITTVITFGMTFVLKKYPQARGLLPLVGRVSDLIYKYLARRGFNKIYSEGLFIVKRMSGFFSLIGVEHISNQSVADVVAYGFHSLYKYEYEMSPEEIRKVSMSVLDIIDNNQEIVNTIKALIEKRPEDIEVRKLTVLAIEVLGRLYDLKDDFSSEYYQHIVYAINKILRTLRDRGLTKKGIEDAGAVLFRLYKITKVYRIEKNSKTAEDVINAVQKAVRLFFS